MDSVESFEKASFLNDLRLSEELKDCEEKSPNKPPFAINFLEYYNSSEPETSRIVRHIFAYTCNGRHPFFESFANTFLKDAGFNMDWIDSPIIDKDHEYKGIDILVRDKQYAIIIENKLKGAPFQPNQLARYIATMRNEGYADNKIFVVILPKDNINSDVIYDSVWNLPKDWRSTNMNRKCLKDRHTCWCDYEDYVPKKHCEKCESLNQIFKKRTVFIHKELSTWLYDCMENNSARIPEKEFSKEYVLRSAALQFVDFLNYIYQTRENNKYKMDIQKFLSEQLKLNNYDIVEQLSIVEDRQEQVGELGKQLEELYNCKLKEYIAHIGEKYKVHLVYDNDWYFKCKIEIDGNPIKVLLDYDNEYKSDFCQIESKTKIPDIIRNDFEIAEELNDKNNSKSCIWRYDSYTESLLRFDRVLGRLLDIIKEL